MVDTPFSNNKANPPQNISQGDPKPLENLIDTNKLNNIENTNKASKGGLSTAVNSKKIPVKKLLTILSIVLALVMGSSIFSIIYQRGKRAIQNKGELVWWGLQEEDGVVKPLIDEYQSANPEVKIKYIRQSEKDYADRLYNSLKRGEGPDIFEIHTSWIPDYRGLLASLPDNIISDADYKNTYLPSIYNSLKTKDGIIGIPLYYDALTLYINVDIFNNARKDPPKTWNEVLFLSDPEKGGLTLKNGNDLVQSAIALGSTTNVDHWQDILALVMMQNKINPINPDTKSLNESIAYLKDFVKNGVWSTRLPNSTTTFARGNLAMYFGTYSRAPEILRINPNLRFRTVPLPQLPNNAPTDPQYSYSSYFFEAVDKSSTNKLIAWNFLKFLSEKSSIDKINQGRKSVRALEYPSPRRDMIQTYEKDAVMGSILLYSDVAKSWYLADKANDSEGGINTNITKLYKDAFDKGKVDDSFAQQIISMLTKFGVVSR